MQTETTIAVVLTGVIVKLLDFISNLFSKKEEKNISIDLEHLKKSLSEILEIVSKTDNDGVPLIYFPRSFLQNQTTQGELLNRSLYMQLNQEKAMEKTITILDRLISTVTIIEERLLNKKDK